MTSQELKDSAAVDGVDIQGVTDDEELVVVFLNQLCDL